MKTLAVYFEALTGDDLAPGVLAASGISGIRFASGNPVQNRPVREARRQAPVRPVHQCDN
jgi:hypothetical protein